MVIEPLSNYHNRLSFDCGIERMNDFLRKTAKQHADKDIGITHVVIENDGSPDILGYITLTMKSVMRGSLPNAKKLPRGEYTVAFIGQIAVDKNWQGHGIGKKLLYFMMQKSLNVSATFGLIGIALDLLQDEGETEEIVNRRRQFYIDRGFKPLADDTHRLYISMNEVRKMGLK